MRGARHLAVAVLTLAMLLGSSSIAFTPHTSAREIQVGEPVVVTVDALNVRSAPALTGSIVAVLHYTDVVRVVSAPTYADGYTWYQIQRADITIGWAVQGFIPGSAGPPDSTPYWPTVPTTPTTPASGTFIYGDPVMVSTNLLNVRLLPSISAPILTVYPYATEGTITGGPTVADNITWYAVDNYGWVSGEYLWLNACGCRDGVYPPEDGAGSTGGLSVTAAVLNVRSAPSLGGTIVDTRSYGQTVSQYGEATAADGSRWIAIDNAQTRWVSALYVA